MNAILQTIAEGMAQNAIRCLEIQKELQDASENGPWRYPSSEIADMWIELTERMEDAKRRVSAINATYDPSVATAIFTEMFSIVCDGVT